VFFSSLRPSPALGGGFFIFRTGRNRKKLKIKNEKLKMLSNDADAFDLGQLRSTS